MTTEEAKYAVEHGAIVIYNGWEAKAVAIISQVIYRWQSYGWHNSLRLVPLNGSDSVTEARMSDCRLKEPMGK